MVHPLSLPVRAPPLLASRWTSRPACSAAGGQAHQIEDLYKKALATNRFDAAVSLARKTSHVLAMALMQEYFEVAERYQAGTLCEPAPKPKRSVFDPVPYHVVGTCFGKQPLSRIATQPAFSFGNLTREGNEKVRRLTKSIAILAHATPRHVGAQT